MIHPDDIELVLDEYILPGQFVPLDAWNTEDLVSLHNAIDAELQRRYEASNERA